MSTMIKDLSHSVAAVGGTYDFIDEVVPSNCKLILKGFGNDLDNIAGWTFCHWRFLRNGIPAYPMDDIYDQMGYSAQRQPTQQLIWQGGDRFQLRGINDHAALAIGMLISVEYEFVDNA